MHLTQFLNLECKTLSITHNVHQTHTHRFEFRRTGPPFLTLLGVSTCFSVSPGVIRTKP